jgi:solute:Na+ symporter, SSS family
MNQLALLDVVVIVAYILGTTVLGGLFAGKQKDLKTYFVGDRNVGWWLVLISIVATETSTVTFLSVPGLAYRPGGDFTFLQLAIGYCIGRVIVSFVLLPQYFRGECFSAYQLLRERFGPSVQRIASTIFLVTRTVADGLRLYLTGLLLQQFTGWDMTVAVLVMAVTTLLYTYLGGMQAVIWTDLIQFVIYILGAIIAAWILVGEIPGGWGTVRDLGEAAGKFRLFDTAIRFDTEFVLLAGVLGGAFFSMASHGADQIMVQRYLCAKSLRQAQVALILSGLVVALQFVLFLGIGVGLYAFVQTGGLKLADGTPNDAVFGQFIVQHLPVGVVGLVIAAVLAAAMSTLSSSLNSSATAIMSDFYQPLRPGRTEAHYLGVSRSLTIVMGLAQTAVAIATIYLPSDRSIISKVLEVAGLTTGLTLGLFLIGLINKTITTKAVVVGFCLGAATVVAVWALSTAGVQKIAWPWFAPIGTIATYGFSTLAQVFVGKRSDVP